MCRVRDSTCLIFDQFYNTNFYLKGVKYNFFVHASSPTDHLCVAVYFGDDTRRVLYRGGSACADNFDSVTGDSNVFEVPYETKMLFDHW